MHGVSWCTMPMTHANLPGVLHAPHWRELGCWVRASAARAGRWWHTAAPLQAQIADTHCQVALQPPTMRLSFDMSDVHATAILVRMSVLAQGQGCPVTRCLRWASWVDRILFSSGKRVWENRQDRQPLFKTIKPEPGSCCACVQSSRQQERPDGQYDKPAPVVQGKTTATVCGKICGDRQHDRGRRATTAWRQDDHTSR
jgi:hypothetical protein